MLKPRKTRKNRSQLVVRGNDFVYRQPGKKPIITSAQEAKELGALGWYNPAQLWYPVRRLLKILDQRATLRPEYRYSDHVLNTDGKYYFAKVTLENGEEALSKVDSKGKPVLHMPNFIAESFHPAGYPNLPQHDAAHDSEPLKVGKLLLTAEELSKFKSGNLRRENRDMNTLSISRKEGVFIPSRGLLNEEEYKEYLESLGPIDENSPIKGVRLKGNRFTTTTLDTVIDEMIAQEAVERGEALTPEEIEEWEALRQKVTARVPGWHRPSQRVDNVSLTFGRGAPEDVRKPVEGIDVEVPVVNLQPILNRHNTQSFFSIKHPDGAVPTKNLGELYQEQIDEAGTALNMGFGVLFTPEETFGFIEHMAKRYGLKKEMLSIDNDEDFEKFVEMLRGETRPGKRFSEEELELLRNIDLTEMYPGTPLSDEARARLITAMLPKDEHPNSKK